MNQSNQKLTNQSNSVYVSYMTGSGNKRQRVSKSFPTEKLYYEWFGHQKEIQIMTLSGLSYL